MRIPWIWRMVRHAQKSHSLPDGLRAKILHFAFPVLAKASMSMEITLLMHKNYKPLMKKDNYVVM